MWSVAVRIVMIISWLHMMAQLILVFEYEDYVYLHPDYFWWHRWCSMFIYHEQVSPYPDYYIGGGWGCEISCGGHHRQSGKTTMGSALDGAVPDFTKILAYLVHNMSRSQLYLGFDHFGWLLLFSVNNILAGLWLNCISSVEITLFLLVDILLQQRDLFRC